MQSESPDILYEDSSLLVCVKPAGTATQSRSVAAPDMVSILKNHLAAAGGAPYLGLIHRLDQPVRGVMVFAKTPAAAAALSRSLNSGKFRKYYRALVSAPPQEPEGILEDYIAQDKRSNLSRICSRTDPGAKKARLSYRTVTDGPLCFPDRSGACELEICLDTGRHHQIRVQLAHIGCPIAGDARYGDPADRRGLCLCAVRLSFPHPQTGRSMEFSLLT